MSEGRARAKTTLLACLNPDSPEAALADPRLAAARRKLDAASAAFDRGQKVPLEDLPEVKAVAQARRNFAEAVKASQGLKAAAAARRQIDDTVAADEKVAAQAGRFAAADEVHARQRKSVADIETTIRDAAARAVGRDAAVQEAARAAATVRDRVGRTIEEQAAAERQARQAAQVVLNDSVQAVIAEHPAAKALQTEVQSLEERLRKLRFQREQLGGGPVVK